jgi:hypothetical protein
MAGGNAQDHERVIATLEDDGLDGMMIYRTEWRSESRSGSAILTMGDSLLHCYRTVAWARYGC